MTEKERVIEELQKRLITEMAETRSSFAEKLKHSYPTVIEHLVLILTQPNNSSVNHWKTEIYGNFFRFEKLKYSKKYPTRQDFLDCGMETCFESIEDQLDTYIIEVYSKELDRDILRIKDINLDIDIELLGKLITQYFNWCIDNMNSKTGVIDKADAYSKMDDLIQEYNKNC